VPFLDAKQRALHYLKHGHKFGAADDFEYEKLADAFMGAPWHPGLHDGVRRNSTRDRIRLDEMTLHSGVAYNKTILRTYHIRFSYEISRAGGMAGFMAQECAR
jgi:hypothetical protein